MTYLHKAFTDTLYAYMHIGLFQTRTALQPNTLNTPSKQASPQHHQFSLPSQCELFAHSTPRITIVLFWSHWLITICFPLCDRPYHCFRLTLSHCPTLLQPFSN